MPPTDKPLPLRLPWRRTWPEVPHDYLMRNERGFCRVYSVQQGPQRNRWYWTASDVRKLGEGVEDTAKQAARAAERAFIGE